MAALSKVGWSIPWEWMIFGILLPRRMMIDPLAADWKSSAVPLNPSGDM